ncbi:MAG: hypothetical protein L0Y68_06420 [Candidatus Dadabacteria bacterium]|nr:hypothetical protein [Candidatus Dadabacteria bacterium]
MSSEKDFSDAHMKEEMINKYRKTEIYVEYKRILEELRKEYEKIRDEVINGYLLRKLQMCYKELKLIEKSLRDKYREGGRELLDKRVKDKGRPN